MPSQPLPILYPSEAPTDTVVVSPFPVAGNDRNTGPRYRAEARATGFDIIGLERWGTNTLRPDWALRRSLTEPRFIDLCLELSAVLAPLCARYETVILRGQSTGAFPVLGLLRAGLLPVAGLVIEDGLNIRRRPDGRRLGMLSSRLEWARQERRERRLMQRPPVAGWVDPAKLPPRPRAVGEFLVEQFHWGRLWRSDFTRSSMVDVLRSKPSVAVVVTFFGNTATASRADVESFRRGVCDLQLDDGVVGERADIFIDYDSEGWHGYLVYAEYGIANLLRCADMVRRFRQH